MRIVRDPVTDSMVAEIATFPSVRPSTTPEDDIVALVVSLDDHVMEWPVTSCPEAVNPLAESFMESPAVKTVSEDETETNDICGGGASVGPEQAVTAAMTAPRVIQKRRVGDVMEKVISKNGANSYLSITFNTLPWFRFVAGHSLTEVACVWFTPKPKVSW